MHPQRIDQIQISTQQAVGVSYVYSVLLLIKIYRMHAIRLNLMHFNLILIDPLCQSRIHLTGKYGVELSSV